MKHSPTKSIRTAIFGGSFDPPHLGHLNLAQSLCEANYADHVLFIPSYKQPLKTGVTSITPFEHRVAMLKHLLGNDPRFQISTIERERNGLSYTYDTLTALQQNYPQSELFFVMGTDCLQTLHKWFKVNELLQKWQFLVYPRPDAPPNWEELSHHLPCDLVDKLKQSIVELPMLNISSTNLRHKIKSSEPIEETTKEVVEYIKENQLYIS